MERPIAKFGIGGLLGVIASFSISFGLIALVAAFCVVVLFGIAWRSYAALVGGLIGFGGTWLVVGGSTYTSCLARAPDCDPGSGFVPFLAIAGIVVLTGVLVGILGIARDRKERPTGPA